MLSRVCGDTMSTRKSSKKERQMFLIKVMLVAIFLTLFGGGEVLAKWSNLNDPATCHAVAENEVEFHQCRRDVMAGTFRTMLGWYREAQATAKAYTPTDFIRFQTDLHSILKMDEAQFRLWRDTHVPFKISDPLHYIVIVWHSAPDLVQYLVEANLKLQAVADDSVITEDVDRFKMRMRLQLPRLDIERLCSELLPDLGCPNFGSAFPKVPDPEVIENNTS